MLTEFQTVSCFILSCSNCIHWPKMSENVWLICFSSWAVRSRNVLHWLLCAVFSESISRIGTDVSLSNSPSAISFSSMASFMGVLASTIGVELISWRKISVLTWRSAYIFACPLLTIASQRACLVIMSWVCTGSVMVTVAFFWSPLMISFPYSVPKYCTIFPCWCASDLIQPCVHNQTHCWSGRCKTLS